MWNKNDQKGQDRRMTTQTSWRVGLWTLLIAVTALGGVASAQSRQGYGSRITVYADINFAGQSAMFDGDTPNMVSAGWNDNISSIRVPNGETWEICVDANYGNQCQAVTGSIADLRSSGWNDRISSLRRINNGGGRDRGWDGRNTNENSGAGVTVYADRNFGGRSATFRSDTPNMVTAGWNDTISSIRVANEETWEVCQDVDYGNQCRTLPGNVADLRGMGWDNRISSLRRIDNNGYSDRQWGRGNGNGNGNRNRNGNGSAGVTVYANPNYRGQSALLRNDTPNLVSFNLNDKVSSIRIPNGETWEVCQDINYESQCEVLSASVTDLGRNGWGDRISSLRRVNDRGFGNRQTGTSGAFGNIFQRGLLFFDRPGFRGASTPVSMGSSRMGVPAWQGSVQIRGGGAWELCDTSGNCETIDQDVSDLSDLGLNDRIVSARIVNNSRR
jgi:Beta/Gamma crystallin